MHSHGFIKRMKREKSLHLIVLPCLIMLLVFSYTPMAGIIVAFQNFNPAKGLFGNSDFIGLGNFEYMMAMPNIGRVMWNTVYISVLKILLGTFVPITVALLLNEVRNIVFKRTTQTIIYFPYFLSWIVLSGIVIDVLSPSSGVVNEVIKLFHFQPVYFLGDNHWFPYTMVVTDVWKNFGFDTVIYLAALSSVDPALYEAASIDGAGRWKQTLHITLPGLQMIIVLLMVLNIGNLLNAGFDQIFNLYSPQVYDSGDIIDTFVYRLGLLQAQFGPSTAVGLLKSVVSFFLISIAYYTSYKFFDYRMF